MPELNYRARKILAAVVNEFLATGEAVGSRTVTRRYGVDLSAATVRNVMADLEEAGLLKQPHTSAGRVPTELGIRFFVDSLLKVRLLSARERDEMRARYDIPPGELETVLRDAGRVLSDLAQQTVLLSTPRADHEHLEHLEFMRLPSGALLAVLVTRSGRVQNKLVHPAQPIGVEELERINNFLNQRLGGMSMPEVRRVIVQELHSERTAYDTLARQALQLSNEALPSEGASGQKILIEGTARLIEQSAHGDFARLKALLRTLEEKERILQILERTEEAEGLQVFIGAEAQLGELTNLSLVAAAYGPGERPLGTLAVIGPTRMNYSKVIALVDFTAQVLSSLIARR